MKIILALSSLSLSSAPLQAASTVIVSQFNTAADVALWRHDFGGVAEARSWDSTVDAAGDPASGAMKIDATFEAGLNGENKYAFTWDTFPGIDGDQYITLSLDVKVDPGAALDAFGNNGYFQAVVRNTGSYDYNAQGGDNIRIADGWRRLEFPLVGAVNEIRALTFQLYGGPGQNINGTHTLWIDNVQINAAPVPEPSGAILAGIVGLACFRRRR